MTDANDKDPKVKALVERDPSQPLDHLVDAETAAQLERWFGLPSFTQVEEGEVVLAKPPTDQVSAVRERRRKLLEEIDQELVANIEKRHVPRDDLFIFKANLEPRDSKINVIDLDNIEQRAAITEERRIERPSDIIDALDENAPQALLRDLHRLETEFSRSWSQNDDWTEKPAPEPFLVDIIAKIDEYMRVRYRMQRVEPPDVKHLLDESRAEIRRSWVEIARSGKLYNRRVTE
ncbi:MAG: hypothetical protein ACKV2T_05465 [Kofleriaceae bacterium]